LPSLSPGNGCTVAQLVSLNNIKNANLIHVGQVIKLCGSSPAPAPTPAPSPSPAPSGSGSAKALAVINEALSWVGRGKYVYGGCNFTTGIDCSCFVQQLYKHQGINVSRTTTTQKNDGVAVASLAQTRAGDIVVYDGHVVLVIEGMRNGKVRIVHASSPESGIKISPDAAYRPIVAIRRLAP
jgi:cell wall-associated NlpC family hydrolase